MSVDAQVQNGTAGLSPLAETVPQVHADHRRSWWDFILTEAEAWHRGHLAQLFQLWERWNIEYFNGAMVPPHILLAEPSNPKRYGDTGRVSGFGGRSQIRLRPSLLTGTHPHMRGGAEYAEGRFLFVADVLRHEMIHQWQQEVTGETEGSYHGHGPAFRDKANAIAATLGLDLVRDSKKRGPDASLLSCAQWPHCVRADDYYLGALKSDVPTSGDSTQDEGCALSPTMGTTALMVADARNLPFPDGSVDLTVTSPPYGVGVAYDCWNDTPGAFAPLLRDALAELYRVTRPHGRLALNIPLDTRKGSGPALFQASAILLASPWTYRSTIVWNEGNVSNRLARGSVDSANSPYLFSSAEMIVLLSKGAWSRGRPKEKSVDHRDWLKFTGGQGIWTFPGECRSWECHPASFPVELPRRLISLLSFPDDVICDPFLGSGTTALAALRAGRRFVGSDLSERYVASARRRLSAEMLVMEGNAA